MTTINVTKENQSNLIKQGYGLLTKLGKPWMCRGGVQRIDWSKIEVFGNIIECHFGKFEFIKHEIEEKMHYWTLRNIETEKFYKIKRDQIRKNKKIKNEWEIEYKMETVKKEVEVMNVPKITELFPMPLLLTAPKTDLEIIREYVLNVITNKNEIIKGLELEEDYIDEYVKNEDDIFLLFDVLFMAVTNRKKHYRKLASIFHPDKGGDEKIFKDLQYAYEN